MFTHLLVFPTEYSRMPIVMPCKSDALQELKRTFSSCAYRVIRGVTVFFFFSPSGQLNMRGTLMSKGAFKACGDVMVCLEEGKFMTNENAHALKNFLLAEIKKR